MFGFAPLRGLSFFELDENPPTSQDTFLIEPIASHKTENFNFQPKAFVAELNNWRFVFH